MFAFFLTFLLKATFCHAGALEDALELAVLNQSTTGVRTILSMTPGPKLTQIQGDYQPRFLKLALFPEGNSFQSFFTRLNPN